MTLADSLSRTLLLMRTDLVEGVADDALLAALTSVRVVVAAGRDALFTHSGQSAVAAVALTLARSGHEVWVDADEVELLGPQPPLDGRLLVAGLEEVGRDILPGRTIIRGVPPRADLAFVLGERAVPVADAVLHLDATDWAVAMGPDKRPWSASEWPLGALAAAPLAGGEAFKLAMRRLALHARTRAFYDEMYAPTERADFALAPPGTRTTSALPPFDFVSGGAIANATMFALLRLPGVRGQGRILDDDRSALSNLNRNALLRRSALDRFKVEDIARMAVGLELAPDPARYVDGMPLASTVLVGVDDIPSRWAAQRSGPQWMGVGATEAFSVLVSSHAESQPCSGCLHPAAPPPASGPIATAAFVSFLSGLLLACRWQRALGAEGPELPDQQMFVSALRPESWPFGAMPVGANPECPVPCSQSRIRKAA